jgi:hypothetical protein
VRGNGFAIIGEHSTTARSAAAHLVRIARNSQLLCNWFHHPQSPQRTLQSALLRAPELGIMIA